MTLAPPPTCVIVPEMRDHAPDFAPPMPEDYPNITTLPDNGWTPTPRTRLRPLQHRRGEQQRPAGRP